MPKQYVLYLEHQNRIIFKLNFITHLLQLLLLTEFTPSDIIFQCSLYPDLTTSCHTERLIQYVHITRPVNKWIGGKKTPFLTIERFYQLYLVNCLCCNKCLFIWLLKCSSAYYNTGNRKLYFIVRIIRKAIVFTSVNLA